MDSFTTATKGNAHQITRGMDSWMQTIRNAWKAAERTGADHYVGATRSVYFIATETDLAYQPGVQLRVTPTGEVFKRDPRIEVA